MNSSILRTMKELGFPYVETPSLSHFKILFDHLSFIKEPTKEDYLIAGYISLRIKEWHVDLCVSRRIGRELTHTLTKHLYLYQEDFRLYDLPHIWEKMTNLKVLSLFSHI